MNNIRNDFTCRLLADSGIRQGMRILDVGCGTGDLSIMASEMMAHTGEVIGFDISAEVLAKANQAVTEKQVASVRFIQAEIISLPADLALFDAIIGRRVLMYQSDAGESINSLRPFLKPGGIMVFQESDSMAASLCDDSLKLHKKVQSWIWDTVKKEGGNVQMGSQLYSVMKRAGLNVRALRAEAVLHTGESGSDLAWVAKMMLPRMIDHGVILADEVDMDTLEQRLQSELEGSNIPFIRDMAFGICAQVENR